ncbi:MAG: hypothetical protein ACOCWW_00185 [Bacteroidota bacterium]
MASKRPKEVISLIKYYRQAAKELVLIVKSYEGSPFKKVKLEKLKEIQIVLTKLDKKNISWIKKNIPKFYRNGKVEAIAQMKAFEENFKIPVAKIDEKMVAFLVEEAYGDFANTLKGIGASAEKALNRIQKAALQDRIVKDVIQGKSTEATKKAVLDELKEQGWTAFRSTKGNRRRFELLDYVDILSRSQLGQAQNRGLEQGFLNAGRRFGKVNTLRLDIDGYDVCNEWEGEIIDLLDPAQPKPPFHPRCRHSIEAVSFSELEKAGMYDEAVEFFKKI